MRRKRKLYGCAHQGYRHVDESVLNPHPLQQRLIVESMNDPPYLGGKKNVRLQVENEERCRK